MGKEFIEYTNKYGRRPSRALCICLARYAQEYIASERKLTSRIDTKVRDAVLVDAINFLGKKMDFALYTKDLYNNKIEKDEIDARYTLTVISNYYADYIFNEGVVESVLKNKHMNECTEKFDENDGAIVLLDFINFIAERNGYDRTFTVRDLYEKAQKQNYDRELKELKSFIKLTNSYSERLQNGENIDFIFRSMAARHNLKYISKKDEYYYINERRREVGQCHMFPWDRDDVEKEIYAMAYAYGKLEPDNQEKPQTEIIRKKIREMKKR